MSTHLQVERVREEGDGGRGTAIVVDIYAHGCREGKGKERRGRHPFNSASVAVGSGLIIIMRMRVSPGSGERVLCALTV